MGWLETKAIYDERIVMTDKATEDKAARRILKGLGFSEARFLKQKAWLEHVETAPDGSSHGCSKDEFDKPLLDKVKIYLKRLRVPALARDILVVPVHKGKLADVLEQYWGYIEASVANYVPTPLLMGIVKGEMLVFCADDTDHIMALRPQYTVLDKRWISDSRYLIVAQEASAFFKAFKPEDET